MDGILAVKYSVGMGTTSNTTGSKTMTDQDKIDAARELQQQEGISLDDEDIQNWTDEVNDKKERRGA